MFFYPGSDGYQRSFYTMSNTIKDIARMAGVSIATVSRVLNNHAIVHEKTREKVMKYVRETDFVLNQSAKVLKERKTHTIGIIASNLLSSFNAEVIKGIEASAAEREYRSIICDCDNIHNKLRDEQERHYIKLLCDGSVDGIILLHTHLGLDDFDRYRKRNVNLSVLGVNLEKVGFPSITVDSVHGAYLAVKHLCGHGHRKIGFIFGHQRIGAEFHRIAGYRRALAEFGIKENPLYAVDGEFSIKGGENAFRSLMALPDPPDAVFCANDDMALGSMKAAKLMKIRIPEDVAIAGFDDIITCELTNPMLTTVRQPKEEIGRLLFERLISYIDDDGIRVSNLSLTPELVVRESCGCTLPE
jgi:DNA-binding LacI/PurR family transcriptional regulator